MAKKKKSTRSAKRAKSKTAASSGTRSRSSSPDAISLLTADHREVEKLFRKFERATRGKDKDDIAAQMCAALTVHATIEEEIFYPAAREALAEKGEDLLDEADVEHASAKDLIAQIQHSDAGADHFDAKVKVLSEYIKHHVEEEEGEMFPKLRRKLDLQALGQQLAERKSQLLS